MFPMPAIITELPPASKNDCMEMVRELVSLFIFVRETKNKIKCKQLKRGPSR